MYATIRRYQDVKDVAEAGRLVGEGFVPLLKQIPGFVAYYWLDAGDGVMVSTSVFQDKSGAEESTRRAAEWLKQNPVLPGSPEVTAGDVVAHG